jgi:hypothetical protein
MLDDLEYDVLEIIISQLDVFDSTAFSAVSKSCRHVRNDYIERSVQRIKEWESTEPVWTHSSDEWYLWLEEEPRCIAAQYSEEIMNHMYRYTRECLKSYSCKTCGINAYTRLRRMHRYHKHDIMGPTFTKHAMAELIRLKQWSKIPCINETSKAIAQELFQFHYHTNRCFRVSRRHNSVLGN